MGTNLFGPHAFFLIDEYESKKSWEKANYLESIGMGAADIEKLRALRARSEFGERAPEPPRRAEPRRRPRSPHRRPRVVVTRPRNRSDIRRREARTVVLVIVIRLG
ncbi:hypothetical protein ABZS83_19210 [Streptomyces sp. NPDC005426]|uniref:hypothetical protein n=1 Tax=Streptomyces sp. NPDC005426 TaxID=3155344 RepID=UPI0033A2D70A